MALLLEQELLVAGDALGKLIGSLVGLVEGAYGDTVHTGDGSTHGLGLCAQHVHVCIEESHVEGRCLGMSSHLACAVALGLILLHDGSPQHTCSTELGNLHEVVARDTEVELHGLGSLLYGHASLHEGMQVFVSPGEGIAQLLADVRAGIVHREGIYSYALVAGQCLHGLHEGLQGLGIFANLLTLADELVDGVIVDRAAQHFEVVALGGEVVDEDIGELHALALAGDEVELYAACTYTLEQCLDTFGREHLALDLESE